MFTVIGAAISLLSGIVALVAWYLKRKRAPTIEERKEDVRQRFTDTIENVARLREAGNDAEADAMLRRLASIAIVPSLKQSTKPILDASGQRLGNDDPKGESGSPS